MFVCLFVLFCFVLFLFVLFLFVFVLCLVSNAFYVSGLLNPDFLFGLHKGLSLLVMVCSSRYYFEGKKLRQL